MHRLLILVFLTAPSLFAGSSANRAPFPDDFVAPPCAAAHSACTTFNQHEMADTAALRGFSISQSWINSHWDELLAALQPYCTKAAACYVNRANHYTWCNDVVAPAVTSLCAMYPVGSENARLCDLLARILWAGWDRSSRKAWETIQACATPSETGPEKALEVWLTPETIGSDYAGQFTVYALDSATRIPVQALVSLEGQKLRAVDAPGGKPTTGLPIIWPIAWNRVPSSNGHTDLARPLLTVAAPGYRPVSFPIPVPTPKLIVEMQPKALRRGRNRVMITACDASTGEPVEMRIMGNSTPLGRTNEFFDFDLTSSKRPEIWLTSLFDRYGDVVVLPRD